MRGYHPGTEVQEKSGRVRKKLADGEWMGRGRWRYQQEHGDLDPFRRVYHLNGDLADDDPKNLVAIKFGGPHYSFKKSHVVWEPKSRTEREQWAPKPKPVEV